MLTTCLLLAFCLGVTVGVRAQTIDTLYSFCSQPACIDGSNPQAGLIQATDGNFYGTTASGGANNGGTIFEITPGGALTTLYSFCSQPNCADGKAPTGLMQAADGNFYGTTASGGNGNGTVFEIAAGGLLTTLYNFCSQSVCADGAVPASGVIQATDGNFYGTTFSGGLRGWGVVFKITPAGTLSVLHTFVGVDGIEPSGLIQATDGNFYGTTVSGGPGCCYETGAGTLFRITPSGSLTTLYNFCSERRCSDGLFPNNGVIQAENGNLYGTTTERPPDWGGTIFEITLAGALTTLQRFNGHKEGSTPSFLIETADGTIYGPTAANPVLGTVFQMQLSGTLITLAHYAGTPSGLIQARNGNFYGTATGAGIGGNGTIFTFSAPIAQLPASIQLGKSPLYEASGAYPIFLKNGGVATLNVGAVTTNGAFAVAQNNCSGKVLTAGRQCEVAVTLIPTVLGLQTGTLAFADNAGNSPQTVALSGTGIEPAALVPAVAEFSKQTVGTTSAPKLFSLENKQRVAINNIVISTSGDFSVSATTCTASLAPKSNCTISVTFRPTQSGTRMGQLSVSDDASNSPQASRITGSGS